jgi:hypothetical protein
MLISLNLLVVLSYEEYYLGIEKAYLKIVAALEM